jgi:hypothetical protein
MASKTGAGKKVVLNQQGNLSSPPDCRLCHQTDGKAEWSGGNGLGLRQASLVAAFASFFE